MSAKLRVNELAFNQRVMKKILFTILLICIYCSNPFAQSNITGEEYGVYDAVLKSRYMKIHKQQGVKVSFVILEDTVKLDFVPSGYPKKKTLLDYSNERINGYSEDLLKDFREKNKFSISLEKQSPTEYQYNIVSKDEIDKLFEEGKKEQSEYSKKCNPCSWHNGFVWQPLQRKYPNNAGYSKFSRVGFSSDNRFALVYIDTESAGHGDSSFYVLEKADGKWKIRENIWVTGWDT